MASVPARAWLAHRRLQAVTDCVVAAADRDHVDRDRLADLASQHHWEDSPSQA